MISVHFQGKPFNITVIQIYAPTINAKEAEADCFHEDLQDLLELTHTHKKTCPFHHRRLECKNRRDTWSNKQVWHGIQNEAGQRLTEFCQENTLVIANILFQQHKTHGHHQMGNTEVRLTIFFAAKREKLFTVSKNKSWSYLWLRSWAPYCKIQAQIEESRENH